MHLVPGSLAYYIVEWLVVAGGLLVTSFVVPGFHLRNYTSALVATLALGVANVTIGPLLRFLTFPINLLTMGLFTFVVNAALLKLCAAVLKDFKITSWFAAILGAVVFSLVNMGFHYLLAAAF